MAFYPKKISKNKLLSKAWKAAHINKFDADEVVNLPEICVEIGQGMRRGRHSLRSLSFLVSGAARIYKQKVNDLLKDSFNCIYPAAATTKWDDQYPDLGSDSESIASTSESMEIVSVEFLPDIDEESINDGHESSACTVTPEQTVTDKQETIKGTDKITQTSPTKSEDSTSAFDPNSTFGYIVVDDDDY